MENIYKNSSLLFIMLLSAQTLIASAPNTLKEPQSLGIEVLVVQVPSVPKTLTFKEWLSQPLSPTEKTRQLDNLEDSQYFQRLLLAEAMNMSLGTPTAQKYLSKHLAKNFSPWFKGFLEFLKHQSAQRNFVPLDRGQPRYKLPEEEEEARLNLRAQNINLSDEDFDAIWEKHNVIN